ncbi:hypothetical protein LCGC14_2985780, partial [marine sediment metagenome]
KPMRHFEFFHRFRRGYYLLTCLGGQALTWTEDENLHPLYLRRGVSHLGQDGVQDLTVSPFGRDAFWVSGKTDFFQLVRDKKETTKLSVSSYREGSSRFRSGRTATITRDSENPWSTLESGGAGERQWLIVQAQPGSRLRLNFFVSR